MNALPVSLDDGQGRGCQVVPRSVIENPADLAKRLKTFYMYADSVGFPVDPAALLKDQQLLGFTLEILFEANAPFLFDCRNAQEKSLLDVWLQLMMLLRLPDSLLRKRLNI